LIRFLIMMFLVILVSCGSDDAFVLDQSASAPITACAKENDRINLEAIIDDLFWSDYLDLVNVREIRNSKSTGQIRIPTINASCTAFLVNDNTIMTNNHCVPNQTYAKGVLFFLRAENQSRETYLCEKLLATNSNLDFSLLECEGYPGEKYGSIPLSLTVPTKDQNMYLVQENCNYLGEPRCLVHKYLAKGKIHRVSLSSLSHDADTLGGSSGSPIFNQDTHELVGIHHAGMAKSGSTPAMNFGIPMHRIAKHLFDHYPEISISLSTATQDHDDDLLAHCTSGKDSSTVDNLSK